MNPYMIGEIVGLFPIMIFGLLSVFGLSLIAVEKPFRVIDQTQLSQRDKITLRTIVKVAVVLDIGMCLVMIAYLTALFTQLLPH
jgi:hypothetical protein